MATKGGLTRRGPSLWSRNGRPEHLRSACEGSLRRLRIERVPLYQLHAVDPAVPIEESVGGLVELREEGKIEHIGVCNVSVPELERARGHADRLGAEPVQRRGQGFEAVLALCERFGIPFIPWAPLAGGCSQVPAAHTPNGTPPRSNAGPGRTRVALAEIPGDAPDSRHALPPAPRGKRSCHCAPLGSQRPGRARRPRESHTGRPATRPSGTEARPSFAPPLNGLSQRFCAYERVWRLCRLLVRAYFILDGRAVAAIP